MIIPIGSRNLNLVSRVMAGAKESAAFLNITVGCVGGRHSFQNLAHHSGDFEYRLIVQGGGIGSVPRERRRFDHSCHCILDFSKTVQHDSHFIFHNPLGVVALLWQRPGIAFDDHRQFHVNRFADAARARLANKKIGEMHITVHVGGETFDESR